MAKRPTFEETFQIFLIDNGANLDLVDSSSDESDLVAPEHDPECSDSDYQIPSQESSDDDDDEPPQMLKRQQNKTCDDYEPPQKLKRQQCVSPKKSIAASAPKGMQGHHLRWHSREEEDTTPAPLRFVPARPPGPTLDKTASLTPLSLFNLFFSSSVVRTIVDNTNSNAAKRQQAGKKYPWKPLAVKDFYTFVAIIIFSGLVSVSHHSDYWKKSRLYNFNFPGKLMSRQWFEAILWSLHLSNPQEDKENERRKNTAQYDRLFKIKPLYTDIVNACKAHFQPYNNICIGERMVASKARISIKQYKYKNKSTKWGYRLDVLADSSTGYTWNFFVNCGRNTASADATHQSVSYNTVMNLLPFSLLGCGYTLYVDNFYTSPVLFTDLSTKNIGCCGTIRKSRSGFPQAEDNDLPTEAVRGDLRWIRKDKLLFVKWMDTREVTICSTVHKAFCGQTIKQKVKEEGVWQVKDIPAPSAVVDYNQHIGGVGLSDALISSYSVRHKTMKWYKTFFYHFLDIAVVNSFLLYKELVKLRAGPTKPLTLKGFREQLCEEMMVFAKDSEPPQLFPNTCMPMYYGENASASRRYCKRCQDAGLKRVKTPIYCRKCQVPLCLTSKKNCFTDWHDEKM